jgi:glycosyltransferase involved in cell wall biosynthesis
VDLSVVIPVFNEAEGLPAFIPHLRAALDGLTVSAEVIFVDDGSADGSADVIERFVAEDARLCCIRLRRNYGQTAAMMAGFQNAAGRVIVPMDGDGQNDPADIQRLLDKLEEGYDVVSGWRRAREDAAFSRVLPSRIANGLISRVLGVHLHDYGCTLKAYRREVIEDVRLYGEMHRFIPIFAVWEGARVTELPVGHHQRRFGASKYGLGRVLRVLLDLLTLFFIDRALDRPMQFFGKLGVGAGIVSVMVFLWALSLRAFFGTSLIQTPLPLLAATLGLSGILFLLLGIQAEIITRTYFESRGKAPYKIRRITRQRIAGRPAGWPASVVACAA